jgi:amidase
VRDALGAFVPHVTCVVQGAPNGPLHGLTFAAKDLFDVAGHVTGSGNPDWERTHPPARRHAWAVQALLDAGCTLAGKTITDEISLGLLGRNRFYGTPLNPRAPDRVPGGSSSGSASAVAGGLVDLALGTDSGGSVRTPASFCGLYGLRPTHGRVPVDGMETQSPSFDTCGWLAADVGTFARAGEVLLQAPSPATRPAGVVVATDALALAAPEVRAALAPAVERVAAAFPRRSDRPLAGEEGLAAWYENQRTLQLGELGRTFRPWVERCVPCFSIEVGRSLTLAMQVGEEDLAGPRRFREHARAALDDLLAGERVLCLPTAPILPPRRDEPFPAMVAAVGRIIELTCIAGLTGLPQVSLPLAEHEGVPVGLSLIGWRGSDEVLLGVARDLARSVERT